jgi:hypothetical protein
MEILVIRRIMFDNKAGQTYKINEFKRVGCPIFLSNSDPVQDAMSKMP